MSDEFKSYRCQSGFSSPPCYAAEVAPDYFDPLAVDPEQAREQAARCLVCHVQTIYDGDLCIACGRCTDVCPHGCLSFVAPDAVEGPPDFEPRGDVFLVKDEATCIRCGLCAERCPTGAMTMERVALEPGVCR